MAAAPAPQSSGDHKYEFNVQMACAGTFPLRVELIKGCSGAVDRALKKLSGRLEKNSG